METGTMGFTVQLRKATFTKPLISDREGSWEGDGYKW